MYKSLYILIPSVAILLSCGTETSNTDESDSDIIADTEIEVTVELPESNYEITTENAYDVLKTASIDTFNVATNLSTSSAIGLLHALNAFNGCDISGSFDRTSDFTGGDVADSGSYSTVVDFDNCETYDSEDAYTSLSDGSYSMYMEWDEFANSAFSDLSVKLALDDYTNSVSFDDDSYYEEIYASVGELIWQYDGSYISTEFSRSYSYHEVDVDEGFSFDMEDLIITVETTSAIEIDTLNSSYPQSGGSWVINGANDSSIEIAISTNGYEVTINGVYDQTLDWDNDYIEYNYD